MSVVILVYNDVVIDKRLRNPPTTCNLARTTELKSTHNLINHGLISLNEDFKNNSKPSALQETAIYFTANRKCLDQSQSGVLIPSGYAVTGGP